MKIIFIQLVVLLTFFSCKEKETSNIPPESHEEYIECPPSERKIKLLETIISSPKMEQFIFPSEEEKEIFIVQRHSYFNSIESDTISVQSRQFRFVQESEYKSLLINNYARLIRFNKLEEQGDTVYAEFKYESEGVVGFTSLRNHDCNWKEIETDIAEE